MRVVSGLLLEEETESVAKDRGRERNCRANLSLQGGPTGFYTGN